MLISALLIAVATLVATNYATLFVISYLRRRDLLDHPNDRSSHQQPTLTGGGLAIIPVIMIAWAIIAWDPTGWAGREAVPGIGWLILATAGIAGISWLDDLKNISQLIRLAVHAVAIAVVLGLVPMPGPFFQGLLPPIPDKLAAGILLLWFVNLFNFMDGIDGISVVESLTIVTGVFAVFLVADIGEAIVLLSLAIGCSTAMFLRWNWHPAQIFLGDIGSVPLGFLLGWLLLLLAAHGQWAAAIILPAYYFADATITLLRRLAKGEAFWRAHRQHFYQRAAAAGLSHAEVSGRIAIAGGALVVLAGTATAGWPLISLAGAAIVVAALLFNLSR